MRLCLTTKQLKAALLFVADYSELRTNLQNIALLRVPDGRYTLIASNGVSLISIAIPEPLEMSDADRDRIDRGRVLLSRDFVLRVIAKAEWLGIDKFEIEIIDSAITSKLSFATLKTSLSGETYVNIENVFKTQPDSIFAPAIASLQPKFLAIVYEAHTLLTGDLGFPPQPICYIPKNVADEPFAAGVADLIRNPRTAHFIHPMYHAMIQPCRLDYSHPTQSTP